MIKNECYKPSLEKRLAKLEEENIETTNVLHELEVDIEMLKIKMQTLENFIIGDNK
jgi:hypothetical protein